MAASHNHFSNVIYDVKRFLVTHYYKTV